MRHLHLVFTALLLSVASATTPTPPVAAPSAVAVTQRVGQHDGYTRLVLDLPITSPTYRVEPTSNGLRIVFDTLLSEAPAVTSREVKSARLSSEGSGSVWTIETFLPLNGAFQVSLIAGTGTSPEGARLVVDLGPGVLNATASTPATACVTSRTGVLTLSAPAAKNLTGELGLYVAVIDPVTAQPLRAIVRNADAQFPLASSYKGPLLWAVLREVDAGRLKLSDRLVTDDANRSLGAFPKGANDVATLLRLMISRSDNTATDLLHRRIGLEKPQLLADELGLCRTRLLLPTKTWWTAQAGLSKEFPRENLKNAAARFASAPREEQLKLARSLDATAKTLQANTVESALDRYFASKVYSPDIDRDTQNASTPFEFATLLAHEHLKSGLSLGAQEFLRDTLKLGCCEKRAFGPFSYFGGKGGSGWRILTMTGYLELPSGEHIVYAFMNHGSAKTVNTLSDIPAAFEWINTAIGQLVPQAAAKRSGAVQARRP
ncbi:serine hydrolase [Deinococcus yavapaiensis]|nr:serine hydrolase [Deinococcus yavapaiensis]